MADPKDYSLVRLDDNIPDNAVLSYDAHEDKIVDSGLKASYGELKAAAGTVSVGLQDMSSAGEQVLWHNKNTQVNYAPPWSIVDESNAGGSVDRFYGTLQVQQRFTINADILENPSFSVHVPQDEVVFRLHMDFPEARNDVQFRITQNGFEMWREIKDVSAGLQTIDLEIPIAFHTGDFVFSITAYKGSDIPVKVRGNLQTGEVAYAVTLRSFTEKPLATQEYVVNTMTGGHAEDVMLKSVYDTNKDGKVDNAEHADKATTVDGGPSANPNEYYGKDGSGNLGFHALSSSPAIPDYANKVYVREFTTDITVGSSDLDTDKIPFYVYEGTSDVTFKLPKIANMPDTDIMFGVVNHTSHSLNVVLRRGDSWNTDPNVSAYKIAPNNGLILVSDKSQTSWIAIASYDEGHIKTLIDSHNDLVKEVNALTASVDAHGVQLATHASEIKGADNVANAALTLAQQNAETIITNRKNTIKGVHIEQDKANKTITLKFVADSGIIDTGVIDLTGWFGGSSTPSTDHKIYYGFTSRVPIDEPTILRTGTSKTVPTVAGLDITMQRQTQSPAFIYVWIPDSAGTIKGFTFSGFLSTWGSTALTVAGATGKLFSSPNKTSATNVNFEVTK